MSIQRLYPDKELLEYLQNGDLLAFEQIYRISQPSLVFFARRLLFTHDLFQAEEIVQDSLMKFYERRTNFETLQQIKSFLYTVTKNSCLQILEKEKARAKRYEQFILQTDQHEDIILNEIIYAEALSQLRQAISKLPPKCREVMEKLIWEDKNANEVAQELDITVSTVNNQKSRAVSLLKNHLSGTSLLIFLFHL